MKSGSNVLAGRGVSTEGGLVVGRSRLVGLGGLGGKDDGAVLASLDADGLIRTV